MVLSNVSIQAKIQHQKLLFVLKIKKCILLFVGRDCHAPFPDVNTLFFSSLILRLASTLCWQLKTEITVPLILSDIWIFVFSLNTSSSLIIFTYSEIEIQSKKCKLYTTHWQAQRSWSYWQIFITFTTEMTHGCQRSDIPFTCIYWNYAVIVCHTYHLPSKHRKLKEICWIIAGVFLIFSTLQTGCHFLGPWIIKIGQRII